MYKTLRNGSEDINSKEGTDLLYMLLHMQQDKGLMAVIDW